MSSLQVFRVLLLCIAICALNPCLTPGSAVILTQPAKLPTLVYDYIIVGGGTAGLVVANRLTENSTISVLVLEAGLSDEGIVPIQIPFLAPTLAPNTYLDWNTSTVFQPGAANRSFPYIRGRVLGGSSSINFLLHQYGTSDDWNRLASVSGDSGWGWNNMRSYIQKHEKFVPPTDKHVTTGQYNASSHGTAGEVPMSLPGNNQSIDARVMATTGQLAEFPFLEDTSGGDNTLLGVGFVQSSSGGGIRSSSSSTYLANANSRPNLTVLVNATVIQIFQTGNTSTGVPSLRGARFMTSVPSLTTTVGATFNVTARKEVILSCGAVGTAHLLLLSGIGNKTENTHTVNIINNPSVGENLSDHILIPNVFEVTGNESLNFLLRDANASAAILEEWQQNKTGIFSNGIANNYGFLRFPPNSSIFKTTPDPAAGPKSPHWEIIFSNIFFEPGFNTPATRLFMTVVTALLSPTSRGTVKMRNPNPSMPPVVDPQYMTTDFDIFAVRESIKAAVRFVGAPAWSGYVVGPFGASFGNALVNDSTVDRYAQVTAGSAFHPVGTASMSPVDAKTGVVNPDLTVKGADGLRIVDASVFPFIPSCHTQGPVYLLAERASDIIKAAG